MTTGAVAAGAGTSAGAGVATEREPPERWAQLAILGTGMLLAFAPWFSAAAVAPSLAAEWGTSGLDLPLLTVAVQLGFAAGALAMAASGATDVVSGRVLFLAGCVLAAAANVGFAVVPADAGAALPFRALTGAAFALVYPVAMRMIAGWFAGGRGLAIGVLIGGITVGSALPHLFRAVGVAAGAEWRTVVVAASVVTVAGGLLVAGFARRGPLQADAPRFSLATAAAAFREPAVRLANLGYLGHMWELYAMWTWIPLFVAASFAAAGSAGPAEAALAAFAIVAVGGIGCVVAGVLADRLGRTTLTIAAMAVSGSSAIAIGFLFGGPPLVVLALALVWGITVVADSAQFSTAVSELAPRGTAGSALQLQVAAGFVLTGVTIVGVGLLDPGDGTAWRIAFGSLALGPAVGIVAMWRLRRRPEAVRMASGRR